MAENRRPRFGPAARMGRSDASTVVVLGLGRFGRAVALELMETGCDVLGIDSDPAVVQSLNGVLTHVVRADSTDEVAMRQLSVHEADHIVVAIGGDLADSILTCSLMIRFEPTHLWAKANDSRHETILRQLGVEHVVHPERDTGRRVAHLVRSTVEDFVQLDPALAIVRTQVPRRLLGQDLRAAGLSDEHGMRVVAVREGAGWRFPPGHYVLQPTDTVLVAGPVRDVEAFAAED